MRLGRLKIGIGMVGGIGDARDVQRRFRKNASRCQGRGKRELLKRGRIRQTGIFILDLFYFQSLLRRTFRQISS
jgi:hypothetical protein